VPTRVPRLPRLKVQDKETAALAGAAGKGGLHGAGVQEGSRLISSTVKASQNLEFGKVTTAMAGDATALRKRLATGSSS
jgi:hypothetical protein